MGPSCTMFFVSQVWLNSLQNLGFSCSFGETLLFSLAHAFFPPPRETLFCLLSPFWILFSFSEELTLSTQCSRYDPPFSQGVAVSHFDPLSLKSRFLNLNNISQSLILCDFKVLIYFSLCGAEATLFYLVIPFLSSFFAEACAILQALR